MAKTTTFTRTRDGVTSTRIAHTPAEAVALRFAGWREVTDAVRIKTAKGEAVIRDDKPAAAAKPETPTS